MNNDGVLEFAIENAALPPDTDNDTASIGYVKFRVSQVADAPFDSTILNRASISFDYQQPVAKPQYFHTIKKPQIFNISDVSLCTGGLYGGVAWESDTTFFETTVLPLFDSLNFVQLNIGQFGATVVLDTFTIAGMPLNGWLLENDTTIVENFDLGAGCDSIVVWNVEVRPSATGEQNSSNIRISPNPFNDYLIFETSQHFEPLQIFTHLGQHLTVSSDFHQNLLEKRQFVISTINWQPGVYYIFAKNSAQTSSPIKLVKH
ncbi:MAG: hypothetical protein IPN76_34825 [Saprospiraceae bacterium]|nr:hypothetical protein [Saprospiraceae bacterium]